MDNDELPYFFSETLAERTELTERQKSRNFTLQNLDWLEAVHRATGIQRAAQEPAMYVETLVLSTPARYAVEMAGAFVMSIDQQHPVFLYTPSHGVEKFNDDQTLKSQLSARLDSPVQRKALLSQLSIAQRAVLGSLKLSLSTRPMLGKVFEDQQNVITGNLNDNAQLMLDELVRLPGFTEMLDKYIASTLATRFPGLDQRKTRVDSVAYGSSTLAKPVRSRSLSATLLAYFVDNAWPTGEVRSYHNPDQASDSGGSTRTADDHLHWERAVPTLAEGLLPHVKQQLSAFWSGTSRVGTVRFALFATALHDRFCAHLLDQQQQQRVTAEQRSQLLALPLIDDASTVVSTHRPHVETAQVGPATPPIEFANTLVIGQTPGSSAIQVLLYSPLQGLQTFPDLATLKTHLLQMFNSPQTFDDWKYCLSRPQYYKKTGLTDAQITTRAITGIIFNQLLQGVLNTQEQNLEYAFDLFRQSKGALNLEAAIDHLLDVRRMLDPQLLTLETQGRWSTQLTPSWLTPAAPTTSSGLSLLAAARLELQSLERANSELEKTLAARPSLRNSAATLLDNTLAAAKHNVSALGVWVNQYPTLPGDTEKRTPTSSISMVDHFLQRFCAQAEPVASTSNVGLFSAPAAGISTQLNSLTITQFNTVIDTAISTFAAFLHLASAPAPLPALLATTMETALKAEVRLRTLNQSLSLNDQAIVLAVLDSYQRTTRRYLNGFRPDAFSVSLNAVGQSDELTLSSVFVLTERGGLDPLYSGRALLWTPVLGFEVFSSLVKLRTELNVRLLDPHERLTLLDNLKPADRHPHQQFELGELTLIQDNLTNYLQQAWVQREHTQRVGILAKKPTAEYLQMLWQSQVIQSVAPTNLERAIALARSLTLQHSLPAWLGMAPPQDQQLHAEILEQYRHNAPNRQDYLHGIQSLPQFAEDKLSALLQSLDPQNTVVLHEIQVTLATAPPSTQSLVQYALNHQDQWRSASVKFSTTITTPLSARLNDQALQSRIQTLNLASDYHQYLLTHLTAGKPGAQDRQQRFGKQLRWQLMQYAHAKTLQNQLSPTVFGYLQQLLDMPDAFARATVVNANAMIRPLQLITTNAAGAVKLVGVYLISSTEDNTGPQLLYAPYSRTHDLKEYPDEASLISELMAPGNLQDWVLKLAPALSHLLTSTATTQPAVRLASNAITGPLFKQLFNDNTLLLGTLLECQRIDKARAGWDLAKDLFSNEIPQILQFLAGKLAYPWIVWKSYKLFKASAEDLQSHHWDAAMENFVKGVAEMALLRDSVPSTAESDAAQTPSPTNTTPTQPEIAWPAIDVTSPERTQLQAYEVDQPVLQELTEDSAQGLYRSIDNVSYAAVEGRVMQVITSDARWRITSAEVGPFIQHNARMQWMLSRTHPMLGARRAFSRVTNRFYSCAMARRTMNIEAIGMRAIQIFYPERHLMISEALALATRYAQNAVANLLLLTRTPQIATRSLALIKAFFGLQTLEPRQLRTLQSTVSTILNALLEPSLTSPRSERFVVGTPRITPPSGTQAIMAFTIVPDRHQLLYLTNSFFLRDFGYADHLTQAFDAGAHARAVVLTHEISHHVKRTENLAYVDAAHPFHDLIDVTTQAGAGLKTMLLNRQNGTFSLTTPVQKLFQVFDPVTGRNVDPADGARSEGVLQRILTLTGGQTLDDARRIFQTAPTKRVNCMLSNADTLALFISKLGRWLDTPPSPTSSFDEAIG